MPVPMAQVVEITDFFIFDQQLERTLLAFFMVPSFSPANFADRTAEGHTAQQTLEGHRDKQYSR